MAYIVAKPNGTFEVRESWRSPAGPRSKTLATFRDFTSAVATQASERSSVPIEIDDLRRKAVRAGAPVREPEVERAAKSLLRQLSLGHRPRPALAGLIAESLPQSQGSPVSHEAQRMKLWAGASMEERAEALTDLLGLGDALPAPAREEAARFPRIDSGA